MYRNLLLALALPCLFAVGLHAQVIYSEPAFPTPEEEVTVFFNASEGNGGLENCGCDVYLHTGVITELSSSPSDWRYVPTTWGQSNADWRMEPVPGQPNLYQYTFSPSVREYYNVPNGEQIEEMAFVFRDGAGNQTGRAEDGSDIFLPLYADGAGFAAVLQSPSNNALVLSSGEVVTVRVATSEEATMTLADNGDVLATITGTLLDYQLIAGAEGTHVVTITVEHNGEQEELSFAYAVPLSISATDVPDDREDGITVEGGQLKLALFAPGKENVFVLGDFNDWRPDTDYQMTPSSDGTWWINIDGIGEDETFAFQYLVDGELRIADPYSRLVLDPFNDPFIDESVYPNLPDYPEAAQGIATLVQPSAAEYEWQFDFERPEKERLVIYELLLRDFLESHSYSDLIDTLPYLARMGFNVLQLMPVNEFEGNISWGYNPSYHMAMDKYYGTISEFKRLVDVCHSLNMAVTVDVVYNHAFGQSPLARLYWDGANNRPAADNPWLNPIPTHPFNVGNDFNHESPHTRRFVKQVMRYWLEEMRVDGFRFDLSKGFTQTNNLNDVGAWSAYDASRIAILKEYADVMWATSPGSYAIMEHFADWSEEQELVNYGEGMLMWNNMNHSYRNAIEGNGSSFDGTSYTARGWDTPGLISYMESHDEERLMYTALTEGNSSGSYDVRDLETALQRVEAASAIFYTIPGPKMIWQFGEVGYDFSINYCEDGSINNDCRTGPKPIRWDYYDVPARRELYEVTGGLIRLRSGYDEFHTDDFVVETSAPGKKVQLFGDDFDVVALANLGMTTTQISQAFPSAGEWHDVFTGEVRNVISPNILTSLEPGEWHVYTSEPVSIPVNAPHLTRENDFALSIVPNPSRQGNEVFIVYEIPTTEQVHLEVFNLQGQSVLSRALGVQTEGLQQITLNETLSSGTYFIKITAGQQVGTQLFLVQ